MYVIYIYVKVCFNLKKSTSHLPKSKIPVTKWYLLKLYKIVKECSRFVPQGFMRFAKERPMDNLHICPIL